MYLFLLSLYFEMRAFRHQKSKAHGTLERHDVVWLNKIEIKEVVHCLYTYAARIFSFRKFSNFPKNRAAFSLFSPKFS